MKNLYLFFLLFVAGNSLVLYAQPFPGGQGDNIELWLKADDGFNQGGQVWLDRSGNTRHAATVNGNTLTTELMNYRPAVRFDQSSIESVQPGFFSDNYFLVIYPDIEIGRSSPGRDVFGGDSGSTSTEERTGLSIGNFLPPGSQFEIITHSVGGATLPFGGGYRLRVRAGGEVNATTMPELPKPYVLNVRKDRFGSMQEIRGNGARTTTSPSGNFSSVDGSRYVVGGLFGRPLNYQGLISEVITYSDRVNGRTVESYLALKWGITLNTIFDGTGMPGDANEGKYWASDDQTVFYDMLANLPGIAASYNRNIAGIVRDDDSGLYQKQATSANKRSIVSMSLGDFQAINAENTSVLPDKSALVWGQSQAIDNFEVNVQGSIASTFRRINAIWRVQETGEVGNVKLRFNVDNPNSEIGELPTGGGSYLLFYDSNLDNSFMDETPIKLIEIAPGIWETPNAINLDNGMQFTIGGAICPVLSQPSNISTNETFIDANDGSISYDFTNSGGQSPYTISFSSDGGEAIYDIQDFQVQNDLFEQGGLAPNTYRLMDITDANGCSVPSPGAITITESLVPDPNADSDLDGTINSDEPLGQQNNPCAPDDLTFTISIDRQPEFGESNGVVILSITGGADASITTGYTVSFPGQEDQTIGSAGDGTVAEAVIVGIADGTYTITATDPSGSCTFSDQVTLTENCPAFVAPIVTVNNESGIGIADGSAVLNFSASGGTPQYSLTIAGNNYTSTNSITSTGTLPTGMYTATSVTDARDCPIPDFNFEILTFCEASPTATECQPQIVDTDMDGTPDMDEVSGQENDPCAPNNVTITVMNTTNPVAGANNGSIEFLLAGGADQASGDYTVMISDGQASYGPFTAPANGNDNAVSVIADNLPDGTFTATATDPSGSCTVIEMGILLTTAADPCASVMGAVTVEGRAEQTLNGTDGEVEISVLNTNASNVVFTLFDGVGGNQVNQSFNPIGASGNLTISFGAITPGSTYFATVAATSTLDTDGNPCPIGQQTNTVVMSFCEANQGSPGCALIDSDMDGVSDGDENTGEETNPCLPNPLTVTTGTITDANLDASDGSVQLLLAGGADDATGNYTINLTDNTTSYGPFMQAAAGDGIPVEVLIDNLPAGIYTATSSDPSGSCTATSTFFVASTGICPSPLIINCPTSTVRMLDYETCTFTNIDLGLNATADCPSATLTNDYNNGASLAGAVFDLGETLVNFTASDGTNSANCSVTIIVSDDEAPVIDCSTIVPAVSTDNGVCTYTVTSDALDPTFTDNCSATLTNDYNNGASLAGAVFNLGETLVNFTASDGTNSANCSVTIIVSDDEPPVIDCSAIMTMVNTDDGFCTYTTAGAELDATFTDNCTATLTNDFNNAASLAGAVFENATTTVIWTATDGTNAVSCTIDVMVTDNQSPVVRAADTTLFLDENGLADLTITDFDTYVSDNCSASATDIFRIEGAAAGAREVDQEQGGGAKSLLDHTLSFTCDDAGNIDLEIEIIATDNAGNEARDTITVIIRDTIKPELTLSSNTVYLNDAGNGSLTITDIATATDVCGVATVTADRLLDFTCADVSNPPAPLTITVTATDVNGNDSTATISVTVLDTIAPTITIIPGEVALNLNGNASLDIADLATAQDACGNASLVAERTTFNCEDIGQVFVRITATDGNGNITIDSTPVTVGFEQPNFACIGDINITLDEGCSAELIPEQLLTGNVACIDVFSWAITVMDSDTTNGPVIDGCGNFNYVIRSTGTGIFGLDFETCWGIVRAEDKTPPAIVITPDDIDLLCVDLDNNNLSTPPVSTSRCYRVNAQTGATIPGTMAAALRARLLAGGITPLVPIFTDGCSQELEICVSDAVAFGADPDCDDVVITRTFVATEISTCVAAAGEGNPSVSTAYILTFGRPTLDDLDGDNIDDVVNIESCGFDPSVRPAPRAGDYPFLVVGTRTFNLQDGQAVCNIGVTYSDGPSVVTCPNTYKFVRTYTVIDWCAPGDIRTFTQVVKVGDTTAPTFTGPNVPTDANGTLVYGTNAGNICAAFIRLDDVSVTDNCPGAVSISAEIYPNRDLTGAPIGAFNVVPGGTPELTPAIPAGTHILRYTYTDVCGNMGVTDYDFRVEDQTPPVAICEDGLNISVAGGANNGFAVLTPANIDAGSYDDCSAVTLAIARVNGDDEAIGGYGPQITLTCADLGIVRVGLRVTDALGNVNFCWLDALVEDKLAPSCVAPANMTITCVDYNASLPNDIADASFAQLDALFGQAAGVDNCGTTITQTVSGTINSCGVGSITRRFTSTDDAGFTNVNLCVQNISIIGIHDYRITFPTDESSDCMDIPSYDGVVAEEIACDLITTTFDVDTLRTQLAGDECFKLRVTYDVVNWCEYNSLGEPYIVQRDAPGARGRTRNPRDIDEDLLYVNVIPGLTTATTGDDVAFYTLIETDRTFDPAPSPQRDQEYVGYAANANNSRGFWRYTQFIKIYDEVAPEITFTEPAECFAGSGEGCRTTVTLEFTATDECSRAVAAIALDANFTGIFSADNPAALGVGVSLANDGEGNYTITATNVPVGAHAIRVSASDGCGNFDVQIIEFCVTADRTPTPICIQTLTVTLMNDGNGGGIAAIWASDFIASPIEDCFGNVVDKYSIYRSSDAGAAGFTPEAGVIGIDDIDCGDFDNGTVSVRVYAFDDNGSTPDFCEVVVEVQDNVGHCDDSTGNLSGLIATQNNEAIAGAQVSLTSSTGMDEMTTSATDGTFRFTGLALNADYTVQPVFDAAFNAQNVRASDLVAGIGQILGTAPFTSAYQFVAVDVNQDGSFDVFDILAGQRAILGLDDGFAGGNWFMVEAGSEISMNNPYAVAFPEVFNANDLQGSITADFVAVEKMNLTGATGRVAQTLNVDDAQLESGQLRTIILDGTHTAGFQGTIELAAGLELISADLTGQGGLNLNRAAEGLIAVLLREGGSVSLEVRATTSGLVSELISLSDAVTVREGVALNGTSNALDLAFNSDFVPATPQNKLYQNIPNPMNQRTSIAFDLEKPGAVEVRITDAAGRWVASYQQDGAAGRNTLEVKRKELLAAGVYTYTIESSGWRASRRMMVW